MKAHLCASYELAHNIALRKSISAISLRSCYNFTSGPRLRILPEVRLAIPKQF